ncbi:MAG: DUF4178 domain-containing protein [Bryobacteraceae bacterium]|nr:DUF4178 domain-containing protein [Bryobacteraceae bacterium]
MNPLAGSDRFRGNCPSCGAPVQFSFKQAVQSVCKFCQSMLVRQGVDLQLVGKVADPLLDASPIQLGTEGQFDGHGFQVVGRLVYEYDGGRWNEWYLTFSNGNFGWLSDAQLEYAVSFLKPAAVPVQVERGNKVPVGNELFSVTTITRARYVGVEGDLPFTTWDKSESLFADLRSADRRFATIDYSEQPPLVYTGNLVDYDELKLKNVKLFEGWQ